MMFGWLWVWFKTKKELMQELVRTDRMLSLEFNQILKKIEALDQHKTYLCVMENESEEAVRAMSDAFKGATSRLRWTVPVVVFSNKEIKAMTAEESEALLLVVRRRIRERSVRIE